MRKYIILIQLILIFCAASIYSQIPENRLTDWSNAGSHTDIEYKDIFLNIEDLSEDIPNNEIIENIIQENEGSPIRIVFPEGSYFFDRTINFTSNIILEGQGANLTELVFDLGGKGHLFNVAGSVENTEIPVIENADRGSKEIAVANHDFEAGDWIILSYEDEDLVTSSWAIGSVAQIIKITDIGNNSLKLEDEIRIDYPLARNPVVRRLNQAQNTYIKCMKISRLDDSSPQQTSNIHFKYAVNCGVMNIESSKCNFSHIEGEYSSNLVINNSYLYEGFNYGGGGRAYGVMLHFGTGNCLIENNIFRKLRHSMIVQAGANGNVFAYNYSYEPFWDDTSLPENSAGDMTLHGNYVHSNLFEGNICQNIVIDNSHGPNGPLNTFFRNRAELWGIFFSSNNSPSQNFIANEITNTSFPYSLVNYTLQGADHYELANYNKGDLEGEVPQDLSIESLYYKEKPEFLSKEEFGGTGYPNKAEDSTIPAKNRVESGNLFDGCDNLNSNMLEDEKVEFMISPNPSNNYINININLSGNAKYKIYNSQGMVELSGNLEKEIDISKLPVGFYIIEIKTNHKVITNKFIKI